MVDIEKYKKFLDCDQYFKAHINDFIEAFVTYYGEENRKRIEELFKNSLIILYEPPTDEKSLIYIAGEEKTKDIFSELLKLNETELTEQDLTKNKRTLEYLSGVSNDLPIDTYARFYFLYRYYRYNDKNGLIEYKYNRIKMYLPELTREELIEMLNTGNIPEKYLNILGTDEIPTIRRILNSNSTEDEYIKLKKEVMPLVQKINPEINADNIEEHLKDENIEKLNYLAFAYSKLLADFSSFYGEFRNKLTNVYRYKDSRSKLKTEYYKDFILENIDLIPEQFKKGIDKYLQNPNNTYNLNFSIKKLLGNSIEGNGLLDAFSTASNELLNDEKTMPWRKDSILSDRIEYFKIMGIDLGNDYNNYINNEEVRKIWPSSEMADRIVKSRNKYLNMVNNKSFKDSELYIRISKEMERRNYVDKQTSFNPRLFSSDVNRFVNPNFVRDGLDYKSSNLVIVKLDHNSDYNDHFLIHELNHLTETSLKEVINDTYTITCGWEEATLNISESEEETDTIAKDGTEKRDYELFNEIINELIAQEISVIMKEKHVGVFDNPETSIYRGTTNYERSKFIVNEFYNRYKGKIIESRRNGQIQIILDEVGKENFNELNELVKYFNQCFPTEVEYKNLLYELRENKDTESTRISRDIVERRNRILERMEIHSNSRATQEGQEKKASV